MCFVKVLKKNNIHAMINETHINSNLRFGNSIDNHSDSVYQKSQNAPNAKYNCADLKHWSQI